MLQYVSRTAALIVFCSAILLGQGAAPSSVALTNETVIRLFASGVSPDTIIKTIQLSGSVNFGFLPGDLELLQRYHVPDDVVKAMAARDKGRPIAPSLTADVPPSTVAPAPAAQTPRAVTRQNRDYSSTCTYFTVITRDKLNNVKQGLSDADVKWFEKNFTKKYPNVCYADPAGAFSVVFYITVTPDVYHGTRIVNQTSTHSNPVSGTVTEQDGSTSQVSGTVETTTTNSTAVPYSFEYGIFTLSVERRLGEGKFDVVHRFQQKGLYRVLYGIPLGGKGHHPVHAVIEDATKWVSGGGLTDPRQSVF